MNVFFKKKDTILLKRILDLVHIDKVNNGLHLNIPI